MKIFIVILALLPSSFASARAQDEGLYTSVTKLSLATTTLAVVGAKLYQTLNPTGYAPIASLGERALVGSLRLLGGATAISAAGATGFFVGSVIVKADETYLDGAIVDRTGRVLQPAFWAVYKIQQALEK